MTTYIVKMARTKTVAEFRDIEVDAENVNVLKKLIQNKLEEMWSEAEAKDWHGEYSEEPELITYFEKVKKATVEYEPQDLSSGAIEKNAYQTKLNKWF
jgi:hypothetical protein